MQLSCTMIRKPFRVADQTLAKYAFKIDHKNQNQVAVRLEIVKYGPKGCHLLERN